jgi:hypothetical protein
MAINFNHTIVWARNSEASATFLAEILGLPAPKRSLPYWADPAQTQACEINHHDGWRGFYLEDPDGHFLEVITRPYGSGG